MLTFTFQTKLNPEQIKQITSLYRLEGWWSKTSDDPETISRIAAGSHCFMIVTRANEIIGMGRALSDGASDAYIQDVTVKKRYRGQGIGTRIINALIARLHQDGLRWIGLIAEKNSHNFYERIGFEKMPNSVPMLKISHET